MKTILSCLMIAACLALVAPCKAESSAVRELEVHVSQANDDSPYAFVRAKFEPGEVGDPWAVRFFDEAGAEVPYFVWDSVSWRVAREGREDWGKRFALINHAPGDAPEARNARSQKLAWAKERLPELAQKLEEEDQAATQNPNSMCAVMYLLRYHVPALGKAKLKMKVFATAQAQPKSERWNGEKVTDRVSIEKGGLTLRGLPDRATVAWKGQEIFHYSGFMRAARLKDRVTQTRRGRSRSRRPMDSLPKCV